MDLNLVFNRENVVNMWLSVGKPLRSSSHGYCLLPFLMALLCSFRFWMCSVRCVCVTAWLCEPIRTSSVTTCCQKEICCYKPSWSMMSRGGETIYLWSCLPTISHRTYLHWLLDECFNTKNESNLNKKFKHWFIIGVQFGKCWVFFQERFKLF